MPVSVITDSVASVPAEELAANDMGVVSLHVNDGERHEADLDIDHAEFFRRLADMSHLPTSSQPSVDALLQAFRERVAAGSDVLGVFISSKMSGTVETARMAAELLRQERPQARIEVLDSESNSMQEGFAAIAAAKAAAAGRTIDECIEAAKETMRRTRYLFTPASLEYLRRGGRIGNASALLGQLLQIRPILTVEDGVTTQVAKVRTTSKALSEMAAQFAKDVAEKGLRQVVVHYIGDIEPAEKFAREQIEPIVNGVVRVVPVSPVVGLHVGPAVAIAYETEGALR